MRGEEGIWRKGGKSNVSSHKPIRKVTGLKKSVNQGRKAATRSLRKKRKKRTDLKPLAKKTNSKGHLRGGRGEKLQGKKTGRKSENLGKGVNLAKRRGSSPEVGASRLSRTSLRPHSREREGQGRFRRDPRGGDLIAHRRRQTGGV